MRRRLAALLLAPVLAPVLGLTTLSGAVAPAQARDTRFGADPYTLTAEDRARVAKATAYLQGLSTVSARFEQTAPNGEVTHGVLYLQRPGKARFEYDRAAQMLIVSDGRQVGLWDGRLKSYDRYPLSRTPLNLLLAQEIRLDRGVNIARVDSTSEGFAITAVDAHHQAAGRIVIYFSDRPMALKGWNVIDGQGRITRVRLGELAPRSGLDPSLFVLKDPRKGR